MGPHGDHHRTGAKLSVTVCACTGGVLFEGHPELSELIIVDAQCFRTQLISHICAASQFAPEVPAGRVLQRSRRHGTRHEAHSAPTARAVRSRAGQSQRRLRFPRLLQCAVAGAESGVWLGPWRLLSAAAGWPRCRRISSGARAWCTESCRRNVAGGPPLADVLHAGGAAPVLLLRATLVDAASRLTARRSAGGGASPGQRCSVVKA